MKLKFLLDNRVYSNNPIWQTAKPSSLASVQVQSETLHTLTTFHTALDFHSHSGWWRSGTRSSLALFSKANVFSFSEFLEQSLFCNYCPWLCSSCGSSVLNRLQFPFPLSLCPCVQAGELSWITVWALIILSLCQGSQETRKINRQSKSPIFTECSMEWGLKQLEPIFIWICKYLCLCFTNSRTSWKDVNISHIRTIGLESVVSNG